MRRNPMSTPRTSIPWWLSESLDVVQRCFSRDWALLTDCQRERFMRELNGTVLRSRCWMTTDDKTRKRTRLVACKAAREIFGRIL